MLISTPATGQILKYFHRNRGLTLQDIPIGQAAFIIFEPTVQVKFSVSYHQFGSLSQIPVVFGLSDVMSKFILNCLQNSFNKMIHKKSWLLWKTHFPLISSP